MVSFLRKTKEKRQTELNTKEREVKIEALGEVKIEKLDQCEQAAFYSALFSRLFELKRNKDQNTN